MLAVGIDWAEDYHLVALGRPGEGVTEVARVEHTPGAVAALLGRIAALEPDPAEVRVVLETRHGTLVEQLLDAGFTVGRSTPTWSRAAVARPARKTTPRTPASAACWRWTATPPCGRSPAWPVGGRAQVDRP